MKKTEMQNKMQKLEIEKAKLCAVIENLLPHAPKAKRGKVYEILSNVTLDLA